MILSPVLSNLISWSRSSPIRSYVKRVTSSDWTRKLIIGRFARMASSGMDRQPLRMLNISNCCWEYDFGFTDAFRNTVCISIHANLSNSSISYASQRGKRWRAFGYGKAQWSESTVTRSTVNYTLCSFPSITPSSHASRLLQGSTGDSSASEKIFRAISLVEHQEFALSIWF